MKVLVNHLFGTDNVINGFKYKIYLIMYDGHVEMTIYGNSKGCLHINTDRAIKSGFAEGEMKDGKFVVINEIPELLDTFTQLPEIQAYITNGIIPREIEISDDLLLNYLVRMELSEDKGLLSFTDILSQLMVA